MAITLDRNLQKVSTQKNIRGYAVGDYEVFPCKHTAQWPTMTTNR